MLILDTTTRSLQVALAAAKATTDCPWVASYADITQAGFAMSAAATTTGATNGVTAVAAVPAPAAGVSRQLKFMSIFNADTAAVTVTVTFNDNATLRKVIASVLQVGETLTYGADAGWGVHGAAGVYLPLTGGAMSGDITTSAAGTALNLVGGANQSLSFSTAGTVIGHLSNTGTDLNIHSSTNLYYEAAEHIFGKATGGNGSIISGFNMATNGVGSDTIQAGPCFTANGSGQGFAFQLGGAGQSVLWNYSSGWKIFMEGRGDVPRFPNLNVYANNALALAGGLVAGDVYRQVTGELMVVF